MSPDRLAREVELGIRNEALCQEALAWEIARRRARTGGSLPGDESEDMSNHNADFAEEANDLITFPDGRRSLLRCYLASDEYAQKESQRLRRG